jgi:hypothetical protein
LSIDPVRQVLENHEVAFEDLINEDGEFIFEEPYAPVFLDVIEGRWFEDDWTGERRRADRFSQRPAPGQPTDG